ncbi:hypothetical protein YC2023_089368 [Brassica napus]
MRRTKEDDVLRESSFKRYGKTKHRTFLFPKSEEPDLMNQSGNQMRDNYYEVSSLLLDGFIGVRSSLISLFKHKFIIGYFLLSVSHMCNYKVLLNLLTEVTGHVMYGLISYNFVGSSQQRFKSLCLFLELLGHSNPHF